MKRRESGYWDTTYDGPIVTNEADLRARENEEYWYRIGWIGKGWENENETMIGCSSIVHSDFGKEDIGTDDEMTQVMHHDPGANPPRPVDPPLSPDPNPDDSNYSDDPEPAPEPGPVPTEEHLPTKPPAPLPTPQPVPTAFPPHSGQRTRRNRGLDRGRGCKELSHPFTSAYEYSRPDGHTGSRAYATAGAYGGAPSPTDGSANIHAYTDAHTHAYAISRSIH